MKASLDHRSDSRQPELDGIRGLAICLVLFEHYIAKTIVPGTNWASDFVSNTLSFGWSGVDLFFVLSGFLIGGILMDNRDSENRFKTFYVRRCCRILPPYWLTLAGCYLAMKCIPAMDASQFWFIHLFTGGGSPPLWVNLTFTQNAYYVATGRFNGEWLFVTWSLAVEELFYLLLPLILWFLRPAWLLPTLLFLICLNPLLQFYLLVFHARLYDVVSGILPIRGDSLLVGVICAFAMRQSRCKAWLRHNHRFLCIAFILLLAGMCYVTPRYFGNHLYEQF